LLPECAEEINPLTLARVPRAAALSGDDVWIALNATEPMQLALMFRLQAPENLLLYTCSKVGELYVV